MVNCTLRSNFITKLDDKSVGDVSACRLRGPDDLNNLRGMEGISEDLVKMLISLTWPLFNPKYLATGSPAWIRISWFSFSL